MERIKKLEEIIVKPDELLVEVISNKKESLIITLEESDKEVGDWDHLIVLAKGKDVTDVDVGDIIVICTGSPQGLKVEDKTLGLIRRYFCSIIVKPDNFDK